jgi:hypothetical protein
MITKYVYSAVLLIVLVAWFGHSNIKLPATPNHQGVDRKQVVSKIVEDPSTFGINPGEWITGGNCNIEFINGSLMTDDVYPVVKESQLKLVGWAVDTEKKLLPKLVIVRFTSINNTNFYALSQNGLVRNDVKEHFKLTNLQSDSGFELITKLGDIPNGQYALSLILQFYDGLYVCDNGRKIRIEQR